MTTSQKTAVLIGSAFLFSNITFILGTIGMVAPALGSLNNLSLISLSRAQVVLGSFPSGGSPPRHWC